MKKFIPATGVIGIFFLIFSLQINLSSCVKEKIIRDTVYVNDTCKLTLQPHFNPEENHFLGGNGINQSDYTATEIGAGAWTIGGTTITIRGAFKFDWSDIPQHATIISAKLSLYSTPDPINGQPPNANSGTANAFWIQRINAAWDKNATWTTQPPTVTTDQISISHTASATLNLVDIDVTNLVKQMYSTTNYGFMIKLQNEAIYNMRLFASSKNKDYSKHPKLIILYKNSH